MVMRDNAWPESYDAIIAQAVWAEGAIGRAAHCREVALGAKRLIQMEGFGKEVRAIHKYIFSTELSIILSFGSYWCRTWSNSIMLWY